MQLKTPRLTLVHQILILVSIPLLFEILFVVVLESMWQQTRVYSKALAQSRSIRVSAERLNGAVNEALAYMSLAAEASLEQSDWRTKEPTGVIGLRILELEKALDGSADRSEGPVSWASAVSGDSHDYRVSPEPGGLTDLKNRWRRLAGIEDASRLRAESRTVLLALEKEIQRILAEEIRIAEVDRKELKSSQQAAQKYLAIGIAFNLVLCPVLVLYFSHHVARRLRVLVSNSERLLQGRELEPPLTGDDEIARLDGVFRDMARSMNEARERERQVITMISHDLRTPLNSVLATLNILSEGTYGELKQKGKQRVSQAEVGVARLVRLTDDLVELERLSSGRLTLKLSAVSLDTLLSRSMDEIRGFAEFKNVTLELSGEKGVSVTGDEDRLTQVIVNLLSNAIKFSPEGERVSLAVDRNGATLVRVSVTDRGPGVPPDAVDTIFEPFRQVGDNDKEGSGVGLTISKRIVEEHGGSIGLDQTDGHCRFWFTLKDAT